jgi:hypothetical protein
MTGRDYRSFVADNARWDHLELRADDIIISTPAKCGTTWMQMLCALLIFQSDELPRPLTELSPWVDLQSAKIDDVVGALDAQTHRRFIKSHTPLDGLPWDDRVTYITVGRNPLDVAMSWDNHASNLKLEKFIEDRAAAVGLDDLAEWFPDGPAPPPPADPVVRFWEWIEKDVDPVRGVLTGLPGLLQHLGTFWARRDETNVALFHYSDLQADLDGEMQRLATVLGIDVPDDLWPDLVRAATFDRMSARADQLAPQVTAGQWHDNRDFFHRGTSEQWRELIDPSELSRYQSRFHALAQGVFADWVQHGRAPSA